MQCAINWCESQSHCRGWCKRHYEGWRLHGNPTHFYKSVPCRFWSKVEITDTCWLWTGSRNRSGYGAFHLRGRSVMAHRLSYEMYIGPIDGKLVLDHLCRVPSCVRPSHLEMVTERVNILRGVGWTAQQAKKTHCKHGHPFEGANLIVRPDGTRQCRSCRDRNNREATARSKSHVIDNLIADVNV